MRLGLYQHYKGQFYQVIGVARHSESLEEMIVYQHLYEDFGIWVRPKAMFLSDVVIEGNSRPRFAFIRELGVSAPNLQDS